MCCDCVFGLSGRGLLSLNTYDRAPLLAHMSLGYLVLIALHLLALAAAAAAAVAAGRGKGGGMRAGGNVWCRLRETRQSDSVRGADCADQDDATTVHVSERQRLLVVEPAGEPLPASAASAERERFAHSPSSGAVDAASVGLGFVGFLLRVAALLFVGVYTSWAVRESYSLGVVASAALTVRAIVWFVVLFSDSPCLLCVSGCGCCAAVQRGIFACSANALVRIFQSAALQWTQPTCRRLVLAVNRIAVLLAATSVVCIGVTFAHSRSALAALALALA